MYLIIKCLIINKMLTLWFLIKRIGILYAVDAHFVSTY